MANSQVFDYSYFHQPTGDGSSDNMSPTEASGSNGQFDFGNYSPTVNGSPGTEGPAGPTPGIPGRQRPTGITDGSTAGLLGFQILRAAGVKGWRTAAEPAPGPGRHPDAEHLGPLLVRGAGEALGASISVTGSPASQGCWATIRARSHHLYLVGTPTSRSSSTPRRGPGQP